ncbi:hypothetical protein NC652_034780 [Populus alba x Populus x berolinensis]|nr:hypothetical protein NC652_034780 [Populus alba x Populus x berolinensis]
MFGLWEISSGCCSTIGKNFVLARFVASGYWIFIPFILFHFIGLVAAVVLGFVRVPMLSSLRFLSASVQSFKSSVGDSS